MSRLGSLWARLLPVVLPAKDRTQAAMIGLKRGIIGL
jgi:hypothetical protein